MHKLITLIPETTRCFPLSNLTSGARSAITVLDDGK